MADMSQHSNYKLARAMEAEIRAALSAPPVEQAGSPFCSRCQMYHEQPVGEECRIRFATQPGVEQAGSCPSPLTPPMAMYAKNLRFYADQAELMAWTTEGAIIGREVIAATLRVIADALQSVAGSEDGRLRWLEKAIFNGDVNIYVSPVRHNVIMTYRDSGTHSCEVTGDTLRDAIRAAIAAEKGKRK